MHNIPGDDSTRKKYDRVARHYDFMSAIAELIWFRRWRKKYISPLKGKILEVGIGTGKNIPYYSKYAEVTGIDNSKEMLKRAEKRLEKSGRKNITLRHMDSHHLRFKDNTFDYIVTTCVFCSVPYPVKGLKEIRRVLKPPGKLLMIEHVLSSNPILRTIEHLLNPLTRWLSGVNINRDTKENIRKAGMVITEDRNLALLDIFRLFIAKKQ